MAYSELIKNFNRIRDYMRQFYVYGFRTRDEYDKKSARSYDNERRRIESWLGDYTFELWCWRRLLRVPWAARRSNQSILKEISPGCSLKGLMLRLKLQYFGT